MTYFVGIDGGGTRTTLGIADETGREILRRAGPAGLVDPRRPVAAAELVASLLREAVEAAGFDGPARGLCAGLAGVGDPGERQIVEDALRREGVAERVLVISDGEAALHGALGGGPGILVIAGTGSVAHGRSEDGRVERCGGWGMVLGDEGSGYAIGRAGLRAALLSADGRGIETDLLPKLLEALGLAIPDALPSWAARSDKSAVALLAVHVLRSADAGDRVAQEIVAEAALDLGAHVEALVDRLAPWTTRPAVALHGGVAKDPIFERHLKRVLFATPASVELVQSQKDAVGGALDYAMKL